MRRLFLVLLVAGLPLLAACGGGSGTTAAKPAAGSASADGSGGATQQPTVKALDTMKFEPATLSAKAGQSIQVTIDNTGQTIHDFTIEQGVPSKVQVIAQPGQKATMAPFTIDKPGSYTFFCSQPGHEAAGMKGTLTIQ